MIKQSVGTTPVVPTLRRRKQKSHHGFDVSLCYIVIFRPAWVLEWDPVFGGGGRGHNFLFANEAVNWSCDVIFCFVLCFCFLRQDFSV